MMSAVSLVPSTCLILLDISRCVYRQMHLCTQVCMETHIHIGTHVRRHKHLYAPVHPYTMLRAKYTNMLTHIHLNADQGIHICIYNI